MKNRQLAAILAIFSAVVAGCSSTPVAAPVAPVAAASPVIVASPSVQPPAPALAQVQRTIPPAPVAAVAVPAYLDPKSPISSERSVFFSFDDFSIKDDYLGLVERQGKYLSSQPKLSIKIEGNSDERGGSEYNLALGQKRAEAVLRALKLSGVKDAQMEAVSWGEERPKATAHDESAWAQNRRADLVYPTR